MLYFLVTVVELSSETSHKAPHGTVNWRAMLYKSERMVMASSYDDFATAGPAPLIRACGGAEVKLS